MTNKNFNPYTIHWAILRPVKGVATKADYKTIFGFSPIGKRASFIPVHAPSKQILDVKIEALKGKLSKEYEVLIITDKQYSLTQNLNFKEISTAKQRANIFYI